MAQSGTIIYVMSDGQIIQPLPTVFGQFESETNIFGIYFGYVYY